MEAAVLSKKKASVKKGKMKKTLKNVLCRSDPVFWPLLSDQHSEILRNYLDKYKVDIPKFSKPHWNEIKLIPKEQRPKPPKIQKVEGIIFGITECYAALTIGECDAVIVDGLVNPQMIVQNILEASSNTTTPLLCLNGLRKVTNDYFGISTSCMCIKKNHLPDLKNVVHELAKYYPKASTPLKFEVKAEEIKLNKTCNGNIDTSNAIKDSTCPYLFRSNKRTRVFSPNEENKIQKCNSSDYIELNDENQAKNNTQKYMKMILKKIANNPNRKNKQIASNKE